MSMPGKLTDNREGRKFKRSQCWHFYDKTPGGGFCKLCQKEILTQAGGTTNLRNHLRRKHGELWFACMENRLDTQTLTMLDQSVSEIDKDSYSIGAEETVNGEEENGSVHTLQAYRSEDGGTLIYLHAVPDDDSVVNFPPEVSPASSVTVTNGETESNEIDKETSDSYNPKSQKSEDVKEMASVPSKSCINSNVKNFQGSSYDSKIEMRKLNRPSPISPVPSSKEDSFDHFGKYIASLLRSLPSKKVACRLQGEMINWIMKEQIKLADS
ncbi:BED-type domain-containing protein [Trichonephila inaurata madagascariensis]|uniref:BED-type domain-containing protein n=1 Tax=Trichonephila inaurata madagascariensis TaxID=2747483 RepID=A0A8X6JW67_9ARAC|nr:BED-type domain-containing protein [Trichonephila inaurata madagascariensis]